MAQHYTPMESRLIRQLAHALLEAGVPVKSLKIFGSRARGLSSARSDLDIAVDLNSPPDPSLSQQVMDLGRQLSLLEEGGGFGLRVQTVPFFEGEENSYLARTIAHEAETVWTRT